jgi:hypothetical protein
VAPRPKDAPKPAIAAVPAHADEPKATEPVHVEAHVDAPVRVDPPVRQDPPARPEPAPAPSAARALDGRYAGTVGGKPLLIDLKFSADGRVVATVQRGAAAAVTATGRYALTGDHATVAFVEPDDGGASYSGMVSVRGASGRIVFATGKTQRFSAVR